jgi:AraC-like DNA-binding protein
MAQAHHGHQGVVLNESAICLETGRVELAAGYHEWPPPAGLEHALTCMWSGVTAGAAPSVTQVMPDGCTDLIWQQGHGAFVAGPDTGPWPDEAPPGNVVIGMRFRPGAGGALLGLPLTELLDQRVKVADIQPWLARELPPDLTPVEALQRMTVVAARLVQASEPDRLVLHAADLIAGGRSSVGALAPELAVSERQLRRRFDAAVGYGPKTLHRVLRFRRALAQLSAGKPAVDLAQVAADTGYADQAHLTREVSKLAGQTPGQISRNSSAQALPAEPGLTEPGEPADPA